MDPCAPSVFFASVVAFPVGGLLAIMIFPNGVLPRAALKRELARAKTDLEKAEADLAEARKRGNGWVKAYERARSNLQKVETEIAEVRASIDSDVSFPASRKERSP